MKAIASFNTAIPRWKEATTRQWIAYLGKPARPEAGRARPHHTFS